MYRNSLLTEWLPAVEGLIERLESGIRVLDVGCGLGVPTIMLAEAFPNSTFVGVDYHEESIRLAGAAAEEAGVADRVQFEVGDATSYDGSHDLVLFFDAVHDFGDPVGALAHARSVAGTGRTGRRGRAVRRGHPRGEPGQPDRSGVLRRQLGAVRPAQRLRRRRRARRAGRTGPAHGRVPRRRLRVRPRGRRDGDQPGHRGDSLRVRPRCTIPASHLACRDGAAPEQRQRGDPPDCRAEVARLAGGPSRLHRPPPRTRSGLAFAEKWLPARRLRCSFLGPRCSIRRRPSVLAIPRAAAL